jgi:hypothetical protein
VIAHRAGNAVGTLRQAEAVADLVEVDVRLRRGALDARHAKRLWPTNRLWEKWHLLPRGTTHAAFDDIVRAADPGTHLLVDLKGVSRRVARLVLSSVGDRAPITVATKTPWLLRPFAVHPRARRIRSAGNRLELLALMWLPASRSVDGYAIRHDLLSTRVARRLTSRRDVLFVWAIRDFSQVVRAWQMGVTGVIVDDLTLVERCVATRETGEPERASQADEGDCRSEDRVDHVVVAGEDDGEHHQGG